MSYASSILGPRYLPAGDPVPLYHVVVISAEERSALIGNGPSYTAITAAMREARLGQREADGNWIGTGPRVTRTATIGERFGTFATWLYGFPASGPWNPTTTALPSETVELLRSNVQAKLNDLTIGWQPVRALAYNPAINGPISWWTETRPASPAASITRTRDIFPTEFGRLDDAENPLGPTTSLTHPTSPGQAARDAAKGASDILPWILGIAAVGGGVYVAANYFQWSSTRALLAGPRRPSAEADDEKKLPSGE